MGRQTTKLATGMRAIIASLKSRRRSHPQPQAQSKRREGSRPREHQTMADSNPFAVNVPSALEALTVGDQSYKVGRDFVQQRQQEQLRQRVAQDILNGGDTNAGIARLIGGSDIAGA